MGKNYRSYFTEGEDITHDKKAHEKVTNISSH